MSQTAPAALLFPVDPKPEIPVAVIGTAYTLKAEDDGLWLRTVSDDPVTITIPRQLDEDFPAYMRVTVEQAGQGDVTFAGGGGVVLNSAFGLTMGARFLVVTLKRVDVDEWTLAFLEVSGVVVDYVGFALSDESTPMVAGLALTYYMVQALRLTDFKASIGVASSAGPVTVTAKLNGVLAATATIAQGANVAGAPTIALNNFPLGGKVEFTITAAGTGAVGLKATLIGNAP